jgi:hypothetical protein
VRIRPLGFASSFPGVRLKADKSRRSRFAAEGMNMTKSVPGSGIVGTLYVGLVGSRCSLRGGLVMVMSFIERD